MPKAKFYRAIQRVQKASDQHYADRGEQVYPIFSMEDDAICHGLSSLRLLPRSLIDDADHHQRCEESRNDDRGNQPRCQGSGALVAHCVGEGLGSPALVIPARNSCGVVARICLGISSRLGHSLQVGTWPPMTRADHEHVRAIRPPVQYCSRESTDEISECTG
jgi:hypothetical protein